MNFFKVKIMLLVFSTSSIIINSCSTTERISPNKDRILVKTAQVINKSISLPIQTSGRLYTSTESKLSFKIPGILENIYVREGQYVKKNTRLAILNLVEMNARVKQAESAFAKAERDLARVQRLYSDSVATLEQLQNTRTALDIADSDLKVARFNHRYSEIVAPEDGKVLKRFAEEGELTNSGFPIFLFGADGEGWVIRAGVTDRQIIRLKIGDKAVIRFDAYPKEEFLAHITEIEAIANPYTGTYEVELKLHSGEIKLYSGFIGKVELQPEQKENYAIIPIESLVEGDKRNGYVYIPHFSGDGVNKNEIEIAEIVGDKLLVRSGLANVDKVITEGVSYLSEASLIEIIN
jgi:multidrug efflux system membrane fusion protein